MKILVVDDNKTNLMLLVGMVEKLRDCEAIAFTSPAEALVAMPKLDFDVALLDYQMPVYNGVEFLTEMHHFEKYAAVPIIFVTADLEQETRMDALNAGAIDFLNKPVDFMEFKARVQNIASLTEARRIHADQVAQLREIHQAMEDAENGERWLGPEIIEIRDREREIIHRLTLAAGYKDTVSARHGLRIAAYATAIAKAIGLTEQQCHDIRVTAPTYDMGRALASDMAQLKKGKLTEAGFKRLRGKPKKAEQGETPFPASLLQLADEIANGYRERWDGQGYPNRLRHEQIPLAARMVAIAASFDALITERPFKPAWPFEKAVAHILGKSGSHFDPALIRAFETALDEIEATAIAENVPIGLATAS